MRMRTSRAGARAGNWKIAPPPPSPPTAAGIKCQMPSPLRGRGGSGGQSRRRGEGCCEVSQMATSLFIRRANGQYHTSKASYLPALLLPLLSLPSPPPCAICTLFAHYSPPPPPLITPVFVATAARYSARLANLRCNLVHVSTPYSRFPQSRRRLHIAGVWQQAALLCSAVIPTQSTLLLQVCRGGGFYNVKRSQRGIPRHPAPA
jgi:hypothetical protein